MFYRRRASPKHRYNIIEDYGGRGAPHTAKRSMINCCAFGVPPAPIYKGAREEEAGPRRGRTKCGVILGLPSPSRIPPPTWNRKKGREKEKEGRGRSLSLVQFGPVHGEGAQPPLRRFSPFPYGPLRPNMNSRNSSVLRKIPESLGTFPMSEYSLPIYRSLCLDHFETPHHVRDLIRDSKQTSVTKTHNS